MRVILTGGGTGGHIYPALAIARGLQERVPDVDILYVGTKKGMESTIVPKAGLPFTTIDISGIDRSSIIKAAHSLARAPKSFIQAREIIKKFDPDIILGTGGYVSFPIVMTGTFFMLKTFIHEQNAMPGIANRNLARRVDCVLLTFEEAAAYLQARRVKVTGLPVRQEILTVNRDQAVKDLGLDPGLFTLLAFGGSRGALSINRAMLEVVGRLRDEPIQIIWITGTDHYEQIKSDLKGCWDENRNCKLLLRPFMFDMEKAMGAADLAICRAGASTLAELAIIGLPAILIPYPYATDNHQEKNARALLEKNAVEMVIDEFLDGDTLIKKINLLRSIPTRLPVMRTNMKKEGKPEALKDILATILA
ncbi:undecaprenyldiphospho-muramoylpentapeptide beta-N-acetylglucosaminyltransferase [Syntrophomonas erecta]